MKCLFFLTFVVSASAFFRQPRDDEGNIPCTDEKSSAWCAKRAEKGKCTKKGVQRKCNLTCETCPTCEDTKSQKWCAKRVEAGKCNKKVINTKCFASCNADLCSAPAPTPDTPVPTLANGGCPKGQGLNVRGECKPCGYAHGGIEGEHPPCQVGFTTWQKINTDGCISKSVFDAEAGSCEKCGYGQGNSGWGKLPCDVAFEAEHDPNRKLGPDGCQRGNGVAANGRCHMCGTAGHAPCHVSCNDGAEDDQALLATDPVCHTEGGAACIVAQQCHNGFTNHQLYNSDGCEGHKRSDGRYHFRQVHPEKGTCEFL